MRARMAREVEGQASGSTHAASAADAVPAGPRKDTHTLPQSVTQVRCAGLSTGGVMHDVGAR